MRVFKLFACAFYQNGNSLLAALVAHRAARLASRLAAPQPVPCLSMLSFGAATVLMCFIFFTSD
jgi:hypothetical protein